MSPKRALEECLVKRRIIDAMADLQPSWVTSYGRPDINPAENVLKALAWPYAGHPDFPQVNEGGPLLPDPPPPRAGGRQGPNLVDAVSV